MYVFTDALHSFPSKRTILFEFKFPYPKLYFGHYVSIWIIFYFSYFLYSVFCILYTDYRKERCHSGADTRRKNGRIVQNLFGGLDASISHLIYCRLYGFRSDDFYELRAIQYEHKFDHFWWVQVNVDEKSAQNKMLLRGWRIQDGISYHFIFISQVQVQYLHWWHSEMLCH